jgi:hypothetical protein
MKKSVPFTSVSDSGALLPLGWMSLTMNVPASVPSLRHSSAPCVPSFAWKRSSQPT